ncbi:hypothetical protein NCC49_002138 [Naganishia albida]|nr:hypothetical protein NCC49_002138 [Naganishia albida]
MDDNYYGHLGITNSTIQQYLALTDLQPGLFTSVPYSSLSQVTLHKALKGLSARSGYDTWRRIKDYLEAIHTSEGRRSTVLDVGTGTGVWAYELGDEEPYADVIGIDLDLSLVGVSVESDQRHNNIDFAQLDLTDPLPYAAESFDVVHIRNLSSSIANYQLLIERCARILRTGGMLVVTELELFYHRSIDPDVAVKLRYIISNSGVFEQDLIVEEIGIPAGGPEASPDHFDRSMVESNVQAFEPTLLSHGYAASDVAALNRDCVHELTSVESRYFQRAITVCAHKRRY